MYKFSILVACYNKSAFIKDCMQSILNQSYKNWECIVIDDCSTDKSFTILSRYSDHPQITILRNSNRMFCSSTYAAALKHAIGDICGIVDGDDLLTADAMEAMEIQYQRHPQIDWIYSQFYWCNRDLTKQRRGLSALPQKGRALTDMALEGRHCYSHWRTFRRKLVKRGTELFPDGLKVSVDKNLGFNLEELGNGAFWSKKLYYYRYYKGNMSLVQGGEQKRKTKELARERNKKRLKENITVYPIVKIT